MLLKTALFWCILKVGADVERDTTSVIELGQAIRHASAKAFWKGVSMVLRIHCSCGKTLNIPEKLRGKQGRCPSCSIIIDVPNEIGILPSLEEEATEHQGSYSPQDLFEHVIDSVVGILTPGGFGSGVFIDSNGIIATNRHVVGANNNVLVRLNDGCEYNGELIRSYKDIDLAFVKTDYLGQIKYAVFAKGERLKVGQPVYAIGHPLGLQNTLTKGIISAVGRLIEGTQYIQTDAPINPGNSGGPLFNESAKLVGINTMILSQSQGLGFAIPVDVVAERYQRIVNDLTNIYKKSYCGVCGKNSSNPKYCEHCGAQIDPNIRATTRSTEQREQVAPTNCRICNTSLKPYAKYCPKCGSTL